MADHGFAFEFCGKFSCSNRTQDPSKEYCNPCYRKMHGLSVCCGFPVDGLDCTNPICHVKLMVLRRDYEGLKKFENENRVDNTSRKRNLASSVSSSTVDVVNTGSKSKDVELQCCICLSDVSDGGVMTVCDCKVMYHKECIRKWFIETQKQNGKDRCPVCQIDLS